MADGAEIAGATSDSYTLAEADEGRAISVRVSFTDDADNGESLTSDPTAAVKAASDGSPVWSGTLTVGENGGIVGYWHGLTGSLKPDTFRLDGSDHRVTILAEVPGLGLYFQVSEAIAGAFTLRVGDAIFESEDAGRLLGPSAGVYNWTGQSLDLSDGSAVEVVLTLAE